MEEECDGEPRIGGYDVVFVDELPPGQICPVCLLAMRNPVQTVCGHRFCESCLFESFRYFMFNMICLCKLHISANKRSIQNCSHTYESKAQCGLERYIEYTSDARHISHQLIFRIHIPSGEIRIKQFVQKIGIL